MEKIFIENKLYQLIEGCRSREEAYAAVDGGLEPFKSQLRREVTQDDVQRLTELKFIRISRFDAEKADNEIRGIEDKIEQTKSNIANITNYTIDYYKSIIKRYGAGMERRTEIREFDMIEATKVAVTNAKLYVDRKEGFFGIGRSMKECEFVCECSDIDDVIVITRDGRYIITKVSEKAFFDKNIYSIGVFKRNDERTIYNVMYRDGASGPIMMKRCAIKGITRDKEYNLTKGTPKSDILYLSVNPNGEAEVLKVYFKPRPRLKRLITDLDFSTIAIKGRASQGNLFTRNAIHKIVMKSRGTSTLSGQNIWFDTDVRRLNIDEHGEFIGEFKGDDKIMVWTARNQYYITSFDIMQHFPDDTIKVEKYVAGVVYSVCYYDSAQNFYYLKRFEAEGGDKIQHFLSEDSDDRLVAMSRVLGSKLVVSYKGAHKSRPEDEIDVDEFIAIKSHRAKGKRITTYDVATLTFVEPEIEEVEELATSEVDDDPDIVNGADTNGVEVVDEVVENEQLNLF